MLFSSRTHNNVLISPKQSNETIVEIYPEPIITVGLVIIFSYCIIKWSIALVAAAPTGGMSMGLAALMP